LDVNLRIWLQSENPVGAHLSKAEMMFGGPPPDPVAVKKLFYKRLKFFGITIASLRFLPLVISSTSRLVFKDSADDLF
jgi:hypothetical protein